jgi:hypothetical protein
MAGCPVKRSLAGGPAKRGGGSASAVRRSAATAGVEAAFASSGSVVGSLEDSRGVCRSDARSESEVALSGRFTGGAAACVPWQREVGKKRGQERQESVSPSLSASSGVRMPESARRWEGYRFHTGHPQRRTERAHAATVNGGNYEPRNGGGVWRTLYALLSPPFFAHRASSAVCRAPFFVLRSPSSARNREPPVRGSGEPSTQYGGERT